MPKLIIDNTEVEVADGTNVLEAARKVGVVIPHFCYHPALGAVGACRLCAMKFLEGPVKGIQMSCMIKAQDGMVVSTTDGEAAELRRLVIEWLMINHPHDCPVCDEGGECLLQDYTIAGGHGIRRYKGKKRTFLNQNLGPYIYHEMNRCIECYRCVRFYQDYAGGTDFGVLGSAGRVYFGRFLEGKLESPFSGNLVDICPTGVFTDKTARYRARYWDYEMAPSVCTQCSLGCGTIPVCRYRQLVKTVARQNRTVNGYFICDRARFENGQVNSDERPRLPLIHGNDAGWDEALNAVTAKISDVVRQHGPDAIAVTGSPRLSLEGILLMEKLAAAIGTTSLCFFSATKEAHGDMEAVALLNENRVISLAEMEQADCVVICADIMKAAPMAALSVRQAWRKGAKVFVVGPTKPELVFDYQLVESVEKVDLTGYKSSVVIATSPDHDLQLLAKSSPSAVRFFFTLSGPNAFACAVFSGQRATVSLQEAIVSGKIKGIISFETDIPSLPEGVRLLCVADWLPGTNRQAEVFLPVTAHVEMDGTFINNEGRAQRFKKAMHPGIPVNSLLSPSDSLVTADPWGHRREDAIDPGLQVQPVTSPSYYPPRVPRSLPPGGDIRPSWQVAAALVRSMGGEETVNPLKGPWQFLSELDPQSEGMRVFAELHKMGSRGNHG